MRILKHIEEIKDINDHHFAAFKKDIYHLKSENNLLKKQIASFAQVRSFVIKDSKPKIVSKEKLDGKGEE
jgi:hypothetical protein